MKKFLLQLDDVPEILSNFTHAQPPCFYEEANVDAAKFVMTLSMDEFKDRFVDEEFEEWQCKTKKQMASHYNAVQKLCQMLVDKDGKNSTKYKYGKGTKDCGRVFVDGQGGIQRVSLGLRGMLCTPDMVDYDMANAHPTILLWAMESLELPAPYLREYVSERARVLDENDLEKKDILKLINSDYNKKKARRSGFSGSSANSRQTSKLYTTSTRGSTRRTMIGTQSALLFTSSCVISKIVCSRRQFINS